jgi:hypothetical protein|tara:strand:- start:177 stop:620 length:444 start_codon:yes stop_codon:yes gene_type:complete
MSDFSVDGWGRSGFAAVDGASLTTSFTAHAVGKDASVHRSQGVPDDGQLFDILFELTAMSATAPSPTSLTFYVARDAAGTQPLTDAFTVNIVKALLAAAVTGGARTRLKVDFHSMSAQGANGYNTLYVIAKVDQATATGTVYLNWRA